MICAVNWLIVALRSIALDSNLEHSCVAVYLLVVILVFLFVPFIWREDKSQREQRVSQISTSLKLQRFINHQTSSVTPGIVIFSNQNSSTGNYHLASPVQSGALKKHSSEFDFYSIREKFIKMSEVQEIPMPFPDPPPPIPTDEELDYAKCNCVESSTLGKG